VPPATVRRFAEHARLYKSRSVERRLLAVERQIEDEYVPDAIVEQSSIEAKSTDQLEIKPLLGDNDSETQWGTPISEEALLNFSAIDGDYPTAREVPPRHSGIS
jgi:hypothetical protein